MPVTPLFTAPASALGVGKGGAIFPETIGSRLAKVFGPGVLNALGGGETEAPSAVPTIPLPPGADPRQFNDTRAADLLPTAPFTPGGGDPGIFARMAPGAGMMDPGMMAPMPPGVGQGILANPGLSGRPPDRRMGAQSLLDLLLR